MNDSRVFLRHTLAALAYRATRALEGAPEAFGTFSDCGRQPIQILAHMGDLFDWALSAVEGKERWHNSSPLPWPEEKARFFAALRSEEHTSELQSRLHLVCRLLLE